MSILNRLFGSKRKEHSAAVSENNTVKPENYEDNKEMSDAIEENPDVQEKTTEQTEKPLKPEMENVETAHENKPNNNSGENEDRPLLTAEDRNVRLAQHDAKRLAEKLAVPLKKSGRTGICFQYYKANEPDDSKTANIVILEVSKDSKDEATLRVGVARNGTDRFYSNYLFEAGITQDEVKAWLENIDVCVPIILESVKNLSDSVDEYWD